MIRIWQVKKDKIYDFGFLGYEDAITHNGEGSVRLDNYNMVYEFELMSSDEWKLEELYWIFNECRPDDFKGHSLSASDVVEVDGEFWYCDSIGWKKLDWEVKDGRQYD